MTLQRGFQRLRNILPRLGPGDPTGRITGVEIALVTGVYFALTIIATYPAIVFWRTHFIGTGDTAQNAWNLWWVQQSVLGGTPLPLFTKMIYYPTGVSLAYHPLGPLNGWLSVLLQRGLGVNLPATYNTLTLLTSVASAVGMYALVRSLRASHATAFVAGVIFAFSPFRISRVSYGNLEMYSTQFLPLLVYCLLQVPRTRQWRYVVGAAAALALTGYCSLNLALGAGLFSLCLFPFQLRAEAHWPSLVRRWIGIAGLTGLLMLPLIWPMIQSYADFRDQSDQNASATVNSADLLGFIVPDEARLYNLFYGNLAEKQVFIGYGVLIMLLGVMLGAAWPMVRQWVIIAAVFGVLCLGPVLHVAGRAIWPFMPYTLFLRLPLVSFGRTPSRLAVFVMLALALAIGSGWTALEKQWPRLRWATPVLGLLIFVEFLRLPMRLDPRPSLIPSYYSQLAAEPGAGPILDVPVDLYGAQGPGGDYMLYQTVHHHPIVGGYISRTPNQMLRLFDNPFIYQLRARVYSDTAPYTFDAQGLDQGLNELHALRIQRVVLHKNFLSPEDARQVRAALVTVLANPEYEDELLTVWKVP